jgi:hypothetical protein
MEMAYSIYCMLLAGYNCFNGFSTISGNFGIKFYEKTPPKSLEGILIKKDTVTNKFSITYINKKNIPEHTFKFHIYRFNNVINILQYIIWDLKKTNTDKSCLKDAFKIFSIEDDIVQFTNEMIKENEIEKERK